MISLITVIILIVSFYISKRFYGVLLTHLTFYSMIWAVMLFSYDLRLMSFPDLSTETFFVIFLGFFSLVLGSITPIFNTPQQNIKHLITEKEDFLVNQKVVRLIFYATIAFTVLSLVSSLQLWSVLINRYGSIPKVFLAANKIYRIRVESDVPGAIPYLNIFLHIAMIFASLHAGLKNRLTVTLLIAFLSVILRDTAMFGRFGILTGIAEFVLCSLIVRNLVKKQLHQKTNYNSRKNYAYAFIILFILSVAAVSFVKSIRGSVETYKASSKLLNSTKTNNLTIISPSVYLYVSSQIVVLNEYLRQESETAMFGENSFLPVYNFISKFEVVKRPRSYQQGYFVPIWTNTGTFLREIHADFGYAGIFIVPYLIGAIISLSWINFFSKKRLTSFIVLVFLSTICFNSFLMMQTRASFFWFGLIICYIAVKIIERKERLFIQVE